jgi:hypothetical protein
MTEFPQLADALDQAARRHYAPSRLRPVRRVLRPLAAVAAVAAVATFLLRQDAEVPPDERPVRPATVTDTFGKDFAVFRRPRRQSDEMPSRRAFESAPGMKGLDPGQSRLAARLGEHRLYLVPIPGREPSLCMFVFIGDRPASAGCTTLRHGADERTPMASLGRPRRGRPGMTDAVFPDGVRDVRLTLANGDVLSPEVSANALLVAHDERVTSMTWTGPSGRRHALGGADPDPNETLHDRGCVEAEPIASEEEAERVARDAVPRLLPDDDGTVVATRGGAEDPRLETTGFACGAAVREHMRVFDFRTGSIAVAQVDGQVQVFSVLDRR